MNKKAFLKHSEQALKCINEGQWVNGAYTASRCFLWRLMDGLDQTVLELWISLEYKRSYEKRTMLLSYDDLVKGREYVKGKLNENG